MSLCQHLGCAPGYHNVHPWNAFILLPHYHTIISIIPSIHYDLSLIFPHCPQLQNIASDQLPQRVQTQPACGLSFALASASAADINAPDLRERRSLSDLLGLWLRSDFTGTGLESDFVRSLSHALQVGLLMGLTSVQVSQDHVVGAGGGGDGDVVRSTTVGALWSSVLRRLVFAGGDGVVLVEPSLLEAGLG